MLDCHSAKKAPVGLFAGSFAECAGRHSAKGAYLPSAATISLDKEALSVPKCLLCRVLWLSHSAKNLFAECNTPEIDQKKPFLFVFIIPSKQTKDIYHWHHIYHIINTCITNTIISQISPHQTSFTNINLTKYLTTSSIININKFNKHKYHQHSQT